MHDYELYIYFNILSIKESIVIKGHLDHDSPNFRPWTEYWSMALWKCGSHSRSCVQFMSQQGFSASGNNTFELPPVPSHPWVAMEKIIFHETRPGTKMLLTADLGGIPRRLWMFFICLMLLLIVLFRLWIKSLWSKCLFMLTFSCKICFLQEYR